MNQSTYKTIFSLSVFHSFFDSNKISNLQFHPTQKTENAILKNRLKLNSIESGLELYANTDDSIETLLDYIGIAFDIHSFEFDIHTTDPAFMNYTELSMDWKGFAALSNENTLNRIIVEDLALHSYVIEERKPGRLGQLLIRFDDIGRGLQTNNSNHFELSFRARSTQWWYYIINQSSISYDKLSIISQTGIPFNDAEEVILENGQNATLVTSQILIPYSQSSMYKLDLIHSGDEAKTIISGLPVATPHHLTKVIKDGQVVFASPIYIYV